MVDVAPNTSYIALLGWSPRAIESLDAFNRAFLVVAPSSASEHAADSSVPHLAWDFEHLNETAVGLYERLRDEGVDVAVPVSDETVEWAGAVNSRLLDEPRLFMQSLLFRDKAMMKRRAQMAGLRVGVFEEAWTREDVERFLERVNAALLKLDAEPRHPIHLEPLGRAGHAGRVIRGYEDVWELGDDELPCLLESHLDGREVAAEVFVHQRTIRFMAVSEPGELGERIREACEQLIRAFDIRYGFVQAAWFITSDDAIHFREITCRPPDGDVFEHIESAYGFNAYQAQVLCSDRKATDEEVTRFFAREDGAPCPS